MPRKHQRNMNSTIEIAKKVVKELNQTNESSDTNKEDIQHTLATQTDTFFWTSRRDLKAESESEITVAQSEALQAKCHSTNIIQSETDSKCRLRQQYDKTIDHIMSACPILAKEQYIKRHDRQSVGSTTYTLAYARIQG